MPTDAHGLDVDRVEALLKEGVRPSMVYTVPIANNPTAADMSEERKEKLVQLAREYKFKIGIFVPPVSFSAFRTVAPRVY